MKKNFRTYNVEPNAKINLGLKVIRKLENGYHEIDSIMLPISLRDTMEIKIYDELGDLKIKCSTPGIPTDRSNIIYKIYEEFFNYVNKDKLKIEVFLKKNIPMMSGLGGGSSDGAFFLQALACYFSNKLREGDLIKISKGVGADIPFFIRNKVSRIEGIGEKITEIESNVNFSVVLVKPSFGIETKKAYGKVEKAMEKNKKVIDHIEKALVENDIKELENRIENDLEKALLKVDNRVKELKNKLETYKKLKFFMSGSGSTYFALTSENEKDYHKKKLEKLLKHCTIYACNVLTNKQ